MSDPKHTIRICCGHSCSFRESKQLLEYARQLIADHPEISVEKSACLGHCPLGPNARVDGIIHTGLDKDRLTDLIAFLE